METINIKINRIGSFMSRINHYDVWFKYNKLGNTMTNRAKTFTINLEKGVLRLRERGSRFAFHTIQKEIVIFPEYINNTTNELVCNVKATVNWLGVLTMGFFAPFRNLTIELNY